MADDSPQEDKSEQATGRRVKEAWGEGKIPLSRELASFAGLAVGTSTLLVFARPLRDSFVALVVTTTRSLDTTEFGRLTPMLATPLRLVLMVSVAAALAVAAALVGQTRGGFWPDLMFKGVGDLFSAAKLKHIFSRDVLIDLGMQLVKVVTVGWAAWSGIKNEFLTLPAIIGANPEQQLSMLFRPLGAGLVKVLAATAFLAGLDLAKTHYTYRKGMKMTKQEVRREAKEEDGDPAIRGRRRKKHRDLLKGMARLEVPRADALIVNPTHIAIAIRYRAGEDRAPIVTAKGKGELAEFMRELARSNGIPIVEDIPLARLLYRKVKPGRAVPSETYRAVAAVLAFVYRITGRRNGAPIKPTQVREVRPSA